MRSQPCEYRPQALFSRAKKTYNVSRSRSDNSTIFAHQDFHARHSVWAAKNYASTRLSRVLQATATNCTSQHWGTTSRPKQQQQQQIVHLSVKAPLRDLSNKNKSYILALPHHFDTKQPQQMVHPTKPKQRQEIVHLSIGKILRHQNNGITLGQYRCQVVHLLPLVWSLATASTLGLLQYRCQHWGTTSRPNQRHQNLHLRWSTTSRPKQRQQITS